MKDIMEIAANYAEGKANDALDKAIAQAYADGYRDGYKDRDDEILVDLRDNKTEYIDLGLPSGTLWSSDYERSGEELIYLPYESASGYGLPNLDQMKELLNTCKWVCKRDASKDIEELLCVGPNGNVISFERTGYIKVDIIEAGLTGKFWIKEETEKLEKSIGRFSWNKEMYVSSEYSGYKLPIRLVKTKKLTQRT